jgi:PAS domain S-box-containing protein
VYLTIGVDVGDLDKSKEQLIKELTLLRRQVNQLKTAKIAFDAQRALLRTFTTMMQTATGTLMLRSMLQQALNISRQLTNADEGSLFLLDAEGRVTESILARGATIRGQKQRLINEVLDKGLAGWVIRHRKVGLITDTTQDERWLTLASQPYTVRSALGVPILKGKELLGLLTLMHSEPGHFTPQSANLMQVTAEQMALILDNARLHVKGQSLNPDAPKAGQQITTDLGPTGAHLSNKEDFSLIGIYIIFGEGNFLYANHRLAEIFGYTFGELVSLESVLDLVTSDNRHSVAEQIKQCFQGHSRNLCGTFHGQRKDGSQINVEVYGTRTKLYGKYVVIGVLRLI